MSSTNRSMTPWVVGGVVVIVIALAGAVVLALTRDDDDSDTSTAIVETNAVEIEGDPLPELTDVDGAVGAPAPRASGTGFDGLGVELLNPGEPAVVGFFAHWCPACQAEVDELSDHLDDVGLPDDVRVVAVSTAVTSDNDNYPPSKWFASEGWPAPILLDDADSSLGNTYGLSAFPFWVVVDAEGNVVGRLSGQIGPAQFDELVNIARNGTGT